PRHGHVERHERNAIRGKMLHLQDQLDEITSNTRDLVQPERLAIGERTVEAADLLALGPVVLNFFRGRWCPYCVTELEAWRDLYPAIRERGALIAAISPQTIRQGDFMQGQHDIPFPLLN